MPATCSSHGTRGRLSTPSGTVRKNDRRPRRPTGASSQRIDATVGVEDRPVVLHPYDLGDDEMHLAERYAGLAEFDYLTDHAFEASNCFTDRRRRHLGGGDGGPTGKGELVDLGRRLHRDVFDHAGERIGGDVDDEVTAGNGVLVAVLLAPILAQAHRHTDQHRAPGDRQVVAHGRDVAHAIGALRRYHRDGSRHDELREHELAVHGAVRGGIEHNGVSRLHIRAFLYPDIMH